MRIVAVLLCGVVAACSQTGVSRNSPSTAAAYSSAQPAARQASTQTRCEEAVAKVQQQSANAAVLGSALSMAGGLGGFGGRGGMVAAQAVSMGGSVMQAKTRSDAQAAVQKECLS